MLKSKLKPLPNTITARWEYETEPPYLVSEIGIYDHADKGEKRRVGIYKLVEVREVECLASHKVVVNK